LGIATTFLVCIVLASGAMILTKITSDLVITPIENMITKVRRIAENPLKAAHAEEDEQLAIEEFEAIGGLKKKTSKEAPLETAMLE